MANKKILDTPFEVDGLTFIIRENFDHNEYEGKYKLLMYFERFDSWAKKATGDSLRKLKKYAEENTLYW